MIPFYTIFRHNQNNKIIAIARVKLGVSDDIIYHNEDMDFATLVDTARSKTKTYDDEYGLIRGIFQYEN